jgi:ABC-type nitrate/sulfonate/bicarbonate transport system substrate-binding protein
MTTIARFHRAGFAAAWLAAALWLGLTPSPANADADKGAADATSIRYLNGHGQVTAFEIASALGWLQEKGIAIVSQGYSQGGPESLVAMASGSVDIAGAANPGDHQRYCGRRADRRRDARWRRQRCRQQ